MSQKSDEGETTRRIPIIYTASFLKKKERKKKEGEHLPFDLIKINEPRVFF